MRKLIVIVIALLTANANAAKGDLYLFANTGYNIIYHDKAIQQFHTDFNEVWSNVLKEGYHKTGLSYQYQLRAVYWITDKLGMYMSMNRARQNYEAEYLNGTKRIMKMKTRGLFNFGLNIGSAEKFYVSAGFGLGTTLFNSYELYKDGTISYNYAYQYNYDSNINGVYSNFGFTYDLSLNFNVYRGLRLVAGVNGLYGSEYTDKNQIKGIDRNALYETVYFPGDYKIYEELTHMGISYEYPLEKVAKARTYNFYLGVQYNIKLANL